MVMSIELVLYHLVVFLAGIIFGTFVVAVIPLRSGAQAMARNIYLQGIAALIAAILGLYYTLGYIESSYEVSDSGGTLYEIVARRVGIVVVQIDESIESIRPVEENNDV